jgi:hypothetical protein
MFGANTFMAHMLVHAEVHVVTPVDEVVNRCKPGETRGNRWKPGETMGTKGKPVETRGNQEKPGEIS